MEKVSRVQEGLSPWTFEYGDGKTYGARPKMPRVTIVKPGEGTAVVPAIEVGKKDEADNRRISPTAYWQQCLNLKNSIMEYVSAKKLAMNAVNPRKRHSIQHVIDAYYKGSDSNLFSAVEEKRRLLERQARAYNIICLRNDLDQSDLDTLIFYMSTIPDAGDKFKRHIEKHRDEGHPPFPLEDLPGHDFKFYRPARYGKED